MKSTVFRLVAFGLLAFWCAPDTAVAQSPSASMLTAAQVRELVARAEPADHARLRAHFEALSARYEADAKRHSNVGRAFTANPNRRSAANPTRHHERLAELATQEAATTRELATHHGQLAVGVPSVAPPDSERFDRGEGALALLPEAQLIALAGKANTPAEHGALQEHYLALAAQYESQTADHLAMGRMYRANPNRRGADPATHCDRLVRLSREAAGEARAIAAEHEQMARGAT